MAEEEGAMTLELTPTWVVAVVCTVIIAISLGVERLLHLGGEFLKKKNQKPLFEALQKVKEELMLLGFISLLLTVFQGFISKICIPSKYVRHMLPCRFPEKQGSSASTTEHTGIFRRLLSEGGGAQEAYCAAKHKVPFLSVEALHHLHIFIFVLAIVHVTFCVLTVLFGGAKIRQWKHWEDAIRKENNDSEAAFQPKITHVHQHAFIRDRFIGIGERSVILNWIYSFFKQFYASVTKSDYAALRLGFIQTHCKSNLQFDFHKYMMRALEDDFKRVVGISWYLWVFVIIFLLLNVHGWHTYFWIAFLPFIFIKKELDALQFLWKLMVLSLASLLLLWCIALETPNMKKLLLAVGAKLEHVITQLAHEIAEKHVAIEGDLVVKPSDEHFWFGQPHLILFLIHFILFQNAFEIAFFFWIWVQYGFDSCIMGQVRYIVPRLIIGGFIQVLCSYSTLPLYAIVTQMGSNFKKAIFEEHVQGKIIGWAKNAKNKFKGSSNGTARPSSTAGSGSATIEMGRLARKEPAAEIQPATTT